MGALSHDAIKMLAHFRNQKLGIGVYELPIALEALFDSPERAEAAQQELAERGLLELGEERRKFETSGVRSAALTRQGARLR